MSANELETPEQMAERLLGDGDGFTARAMQGAAADAIRARDEQIAAWCEHEASAADTSASAASALWEGKTLSQGLVHIIQEAKKQGEAAAFRAMAAMLRGSR